jgi:hypothetical protein
VPRTARSTVFPNDVSDAFERCVSYAGASRPHVHALSLSNTHRRTLKNTYATRAGAVFRGCSCTPSHSRAHPRTPAFHLALPRSAVHALTAHPAHPRTRTFSAPPQDRDVWDVDVQRVHRGQHHSGQDEHPRLRLLRQPDVSGKRLGRAAVIASRVRGRLAHPPPPSTPAHAAQSRMGTPTHAGTRSVCSANTLRARDSCVNGARVRVRVRARDSCVRGGTGAGAGAGART